MTSNVPMNEPRPPRISPPDAEARHAAVAADGCVLVQAPAGSGKTTLLAQRYLRLLARIDAPESILALTFTRRAALEMRERILAALAAARAPECPADLAPDTWSLAVAAQRHLAGLGIDLECHPARLRIETIDAFNAWLAGQLPISAGPGAARELREDVGVLRLEAARRALAHEGADAYAHAVERVLELDDQRWGALTALIVNMLASRDRWLPLIAGAGRIGAGAASAPSAEQLETVRSQLDEDLALLITRTLKNVHETVGPTRLATVVALLGAAARRGVPELECFARRPGALAPRHDDLERWRALAKLALTARGTVRQQIRGIPRRSPEGPEIRDWLADLAERSEAVRALRRVAMLPDAAYRDADWARVRDVARLLVLSAATLEQVFEEQGASDFPAISMAAVRALGSDEAPTDLALRLDYRLQHLLIDEFQDTSGAQLELLRRLTAGWQAGDGRSVFCVGDPMQSIYGFRQAEVRAFLELADTGVGELRFEVQRLHANFRSARALIDWVNATFARIMPAQDDRERGAIAFRPSVAAREVTAPAAAVRLRGHMTRLAEAEAIAARIETHRRTHPEWRIAVLVRARAHAHEITRALRRRGVAFEAADIEPLIERPAVRDVLTLTRALLHPGDRIAWLGVLRAPWVGLELKDVLSVARASGLVFDALDAPAVLEELGADARTRVRRVRALIQEALQSRGGLRLARWVECTWLALGGAACVSAEELEHVRLVFDRLQTLEERALPDAAEIEACFSDLCAESAGGADRAGGVEITTIHKAKGLEFDCVIVPALERFTRPPSANLLLAHTFAREGREGLVLAARPPVGADEAPLFEFLRKQLNEAAALEAQRLLYVACTRAKRQLELSAVIAADRDEDDAEEEGDPAREAAEAGENRRCRAPHPGSLLAVLWPVAAAEFLARDGESSDSRVAVAAAGAASEQLLARLPLVWSPPALGGESGEPLAAALEHDDAPLFDWVGETARRVGTLVHAELQRLSLESCQAAVLRTREPSYRRWLALRGVPEEHLNAAAQRVVRALIEVQADERGRWILERRARDDHREHALAGPIDGVIERAVFDRSFIDERGVRWVIDYKTSEHAGGGREQFLDREVERYRPQLERYARLARRLGPEPVRVGLYFPLMRAWREWQP